MSKINQIQQAILGKGQVESAAEDIKNRPFQLEMSVWTI